MPTYELSVLEVSPRGMRLTILFFNLRLICSLDKSFNLKVKTGDKELDFGKIDKKFKPSGSQKIDGDKITISMCLFFQMLKWLILTFFSY